MSSIDVESLLVEVTPESPSGDNLEYEPLFLEMADDAQGKPDQEMGDERVEAQDPNWQAVRKKSIELAARTKDLRVGVHLCHSLVRNDGLTGLRDGLALLVGYVQQYWESVHPQIDPEDPSDPTRANVLARLAQPSVLPPAREQDLFMRGVSEAKLASSRVAGSISYRDVQLSRGIISIPGGAQPPTAAIIGGVFAECEIEDLQAMTDVCSQSCELVQALEAGVNEHLGVVEGVDLAPLAKLLGEMHGFLAEQLAARGVVADGIAGKVSGDGEQTASVPGEIRSRDDVVRVLEKVSRYYAAYEPSSPIPLLMDRAKRLVYANFMEVVRDLAPDGMDQVEQIRGRRSDAESGASDEEGE